MPRQNPPQFRQRVLSVLAEDGSVGQLAAKLADAKRRIRELKELHATKRATSMLKEIASD